MSFSIIFGVLKISKAWAIRSIKVTSSPIPISGIINGMGFGVTCYSNASTWVLTTTTDTSIGFVAKGKVQETMASFAPLLMGSNSSVVVTTGSLWELVATVVACTCELKKKKKHVPQLVYK